MSSSDAIGVNGERSPHPPASGRSEALKADAPDGRGGHRRDPILFEAIRYALQEAVEEMGIALRRSAYSTNIKTRVDFSCVFYDADLRVVAQNFGQPGHLGSLVKLVPRALLEYGPERIGSGDTIATNDPYLAGVHLNDITLISPVTVSGHRIGYVANLAHHIDVGGAAPTSIGVFTEIYQEGVIIPSVKLVSDGEIVDDVLRLILAQIRSKHETSGDLRAQLAANRTGQLRLQALWGKYGLDRMGSYLDELMEYTEARTRAGIAALPNGVFEAVGFVDNDGVSGKSVRLQARITSEENRISFDFTGSDEERPAPVNSTATQTFAACAYVLKSLVDPDIATNDGFYRCIDFVAPEGTVVNCRHPSPVVGGYETNIRLVDVMFQALIVELPEEIPAGCKAMQCHAGFGGLRRGTREYFCFIETIGGGYGARAMSDGPDAIQGHTQNTENAPVEETERNYPVRILRYELLENSEGPGRFRGGLGIRRDYFFPDDGVRFTVLADRDREGPPGAWGGGPGLRAEYVLNPESGPKRLASKGTVALMSGDVVSYRTCGGGGYGSPLDRAPDRVLRDVRDGKVSEARARDVYGVVVDTDDWRVDEIATVRLRARHLETSSADALSTEVDV
jgi:N-methylhydantoinase B